MRLSSIGVLIGLIGLVFCARADGAGILAPTDVSLPPLRVTLHMVDVKVHDQIALTTINQTFRNDTARQLEATYVFPIPENADLTDFQMTFNGKMVKGEVLPAEKARQIYESIVRQSRDPGLIEFIGRRLLQMRIFPIEPNSDTKIQLQYQQICRSMSGMSAYHYPLRTARASGQVHGTVAFNVNLETASPLKNVWSPTHAVEVVRDGEHKARIAYEASKGSLDDDFLLLYDTDSSDLGMSVIGYKPRADRAGHFVLTLTPKQLWPKQDYQPQDVVFVIDTSGSMAGEKIQQARAALKYCIDQLDERDHFNIVRFSTGVDTLFEQMQAADKQNRARAHERIERFNAAGGTNITDALKTALDLQRTAHDTSARAATDEAREGASRERPFVIVFITDGMGNQPPEHTLDMVKGHHGAQHARIFSFGVGHDVNTIFLDQLSINHRGKPTYVQPGENLELVLGDFFAVVSQPVLTNLKLTLPEVGVTERFPTTLGDLYHGQQIIIAGKFEKPMSGDVVLTATRNGQQERYVWRDVQFAHTPGAEYVPSIWAGRKISFLIDQIRAHGESAEMVQEIVALSQEYGIQTPYTSWLVNPEQGPIIVRGEPVITPHMRRMGGGLGGSGGGGGGGRMPDRQSQQRAIEGELGVPMSPAPGATASSAGDDIYALAPDDLAEASGESATRLAQKNAVLRDARSKDEGGRVNQNALAWRLINSRWYNQIGQFIVDEEFSESSRVIKVKFGSDAYFDLVQRRADLRPVFAASRNVVVRVSPDTFVLVSETTGQEQFTDEQLEQIGSSDRTP